MINLASKASWGIFHADSYVYTNRDRKGKGLGTYSTEEGAKTTHKISKLLIAHRGLLANEGLLGSTDKPLPPSVKTDVSSEVGWGSVEEHLISTGKALSSSPELEN